MSAVNFLGDLGNPGGPMGREESRWPLGKGESPLVLHIDKVHKQDGNNGGGREKHSRNIIRPCLSFEKWAFFSGGRVLQTFGDENKKWAEKTIRKGSKVSEKWVGVVPKRLFYGDFRCCSMQGGGG